LLLWRSLDAPALEGFKHQIAHGSDVGLNAFQSVGIVIAVIGALAIGTVARRFQFAIKPGQHCVIGEGFAGDGGQQGDRAADQCDDGGSHVMVAEGSASV